MAHEGTVARRYARALVDLALEEGSLDAVGREIERIDVWLGSPEGSDFWAAMTNPGFTIDERRRVLGQIIPLLGLTPPLGSFLHLLVEKGRFGIFHEIVLGLRGLVDEKVGRLRATLVSPLVLDAAITAEVRGVLSGVTGRDVVLAERTDPTLIAGLVVQVGDIVYDACLRTRLETMKRGLLESGGQVLSKE